MNDCLPYAPWTSIKPATLWRQDDAPNIWTSWPGLAIAFEFVFLLLSINKEYLPANIFQFKPAVLALWCKGKMSDPKKRQFYEDVFLAGSLSRLQCRRVQGGYSSITIQCPDPFSGIPWPFLSLPPPIHPQLVAYVSLPQGIISWNLTYVDYFYIFLHILIITSECILCLYNGFFTSAISLASVIVPNTLYVLCKCLWNGQKELDQKSLPISGFYHPTTYRSQFQVDKDGGINRR